MVHLISDKLVELVASHSDQIIKRWAARLITDPTTSSFSQQNLDLIKKKADTIITQMGRWVSFDTSKEEIGRTYADEGRSLFEMGIPLCEVLRALVVLRRQLWLFVVNESSFDSAFELHQMRELNDRVILFFDRAQYYLTRGYTESMHRKMKELTGITKADAEKIFFEHSFYNK